MAKSYVGGATDTFSSALRRFSRYLSTLDEKQAVMFIAGCLFTSMLVLRMFTGLFESPSMLKMVISTLLYVILPLVAALGVVAGAYLERKFQIRDDIFDFGNKYLPELIPSAKQLDAKAQ